MGQQKVERMSAGGVLLPDGGRGEMGRGREKAEKNEVKKKKGIC